MRKQFPIQNCSVIEVSKICEKKLAPIMKKVKLNVIKKHGLSDDWESKGRYNYIYNYCSKTLKFYNHGYNAVTDILRDNPAGYDIIITELKYSSTLVAAEQYNIPAIVQSSGLPPGVEHIQDKIPSNLFDALIYKVLFTPCFNWIDNKRAEFNLPPLDFQGRFIKTEYMNRFPMLVPTWPAFYPEPHPSNEYLYVGGYRNEDNFARFEAKLESWIGQSDLDIVYISLGTQASIKEEFMLSFIEQLKIQKRYRVIWALSLGLTKIAQKHDLLSETRDELFLSDYLPQYKLLGHEKVKIFVTHGGIGSLIDLVKQKIPSVVIPLYADQFANAFKIEQLSIGVQLSQFVFEDVDKAIAQIRENYQNFSKNLEKAAAELLKYEDRDKLNRFIEEVSAREKTTIQYSLQYQSNSPRYRYTWKLLIILFYITAIYFLWRAARAVTNSKFIRYIKKTKVA